MWLKCEEGVTATTVQYENTNKDKRGYTQPLSVSHTQAQTAAVADRYHICLLTWQSSHGSSPRLLEHDVPHQESRKAHKHPERGVADTYVRFIHSHDEKNTEARARPDKKRRSVCVSEHSSELLIWKQRHPVTLHQPETERERTKCHTAWTRWVRRADPRTQGKSETWQSNPGVKCFGVFFHRRLQNTSPHSTSSDINQRNPAKNWPLVYTAPSTGA